MLIAKVLCCIEREVCNKSTANALQFLSFCSAIPIVLVSKGCRFVIRTDLFSHPKPIVLDMNLLHLPKHNCTFAVEIQKNEVVKMANFSRTNFRVELFKRAKMTIFAYGSFEF